MKPRAAILLCCGLGGCAGAPSFTLAGAYFPAWLACAVLGVLAAIAARIGFVATGLAEAVPYQLLVCSAAGVIVAAALWLLWTGL